MVELGEPRIVHGCDGPQLELLPMHAARAEAKLGGQLMKALASAAPLAGLQHVKRVRKSGAEPGKLEILLCPAGSEAGAAGRAGGLAGDASAEGTAAAECGACLPPAVAAIVEQHSLPVFQAQVGAVPLRAGIRFGGQGAQVATAEFS